MTNHSSLRIHPLIAAVIVVVAFFAVLMAAYGITGSASEDEVMGRVEVNGTSIGGLSEEEAISAVLTIEDEYIARPTEFDLAGNTVTLIPAYAGFDIDEEAVVAEAMTVGREGNFAYRFLWWLSHIFGSEEIPLVGETDSSALSAVFDDWDANVIGMPPSLGAIEMVDNVPQPVYPTTGIGVSRAPSEEIIAAQLLAITPQLQELPTEVVNPKLTDADIDEALLQANHLLAEPITLIHDGQELVFTPEQLAGAYRSETIAEGSPQIVHSFDPEVINEYLRPVRAQYEAEPVDAEFKISGTAIVIIAGKKGTRIDQTETAEKLLQAGRGTSRLGQLPLVEDADPNTTTEELESLGIKHLVSSFTTYHSCCQDRVKNIQKMADTIDEHILRSGQQFSINEFVGQRTAEKGYVPAGTIVAGELEDTVGGGVSQFATTMYNAIFWAGLQDIAHKPHSYYFTRYPEGIEATVSWQTPNLIFRNNTGRAIMIDTLYTDKSITVRIFGDNDGRTLIGDHSGGRTTINVANAGGPDALWVTAEVSGRYAQTGPGAPIYRGNPELGIEQQVQTQEERGGWSVDVIRTIKRGGEVVVEVNEWVARYRPQFAVYEVHPCKLQGEGACPTTTTIPPATTTTTPTTTPPTTSP